MFSGYLPVLREHIQLQICKCRFLRIKWTDTRQTIFFSFFGSLLANSSNLFLVCNFPFIQIYWTYLHWWGLCIYTTPSKPKKLICQQSTRQCQLCHQQIMTLVRHRAYCVECARAQGDIQYNLTSPKLTHNNIKASYIGSLAQNTVRFSLHLFNFILISYDIQYHPVRTDRLTNLHSDSKSILNWYGTLTHHAHTIELYLYI